MQVIFSLIKGGIRGSRSQSHGFHIIKASQSFYRYFHSFGGNFKKYFLPHNKMTNFYVYRLQNKNNYLCHIKALGQCSHFYGVCVCVLWR